MNIRYKVIQKGIQNNTRENYRFFFVLFTCFVEFFWLFFIGCFFLFLWCFVALRVLVGSPKISFHRQSELILFIYLDLTYYLDRKIESCKLKSWAFLRQFPNVYQSLKINLSYLARAMLMFSARFPNYFFPWC